MAESSSIAAGHAPGRSPITPQFQPFEWVRSTQPQAAFLNDARDVVQGAQTLAQLLAWDEGRHEPATGAPGPAPLLGACHRESLQRLLAASLSLLHAQIEAQCEAWDDQEKSLASR